MFWLRLGMLIPTVVLDLIHVIKKPCVFVKIDPLFMKQTLVHMGRVSPHTSVAYFIVGVLGLSATVRI
jgi:hypothetical protein